MTTETLAPDVLLTQTNLTGVVGDIDDDPDNDESDWLTASVTTVDTVCRVSFPSPAGDLTSGAGLQEFRVLFRCNPTNKSPDNLYIYLYEDGSQVGSVLLSVADPITAGTVYAGTWDAGDLAAISGVNVECYVHTAADVSPAQQAATGEIGAIEWNVTYDGDIDLTVTCVSVGRTRTVNTATVTADIDLTVTCISVARTRTVPAATVTITTPSDSGSMPNPLSEFYREPNLLIVGKKPIRPVRVKAAHPLAEGLISAIIFSEGYGEPRDLARPGVFAVRDAYSTNPVPTWETGLFGTVGDNAPTTSFWTYTEDLYLTENEFTFLFIGRIDSIAGGNPGFFRSAVDSIGGTFALIQSASGYPWLLASGTDVLKPASGTAITTGINRLAFAFSGSAKKQLSQIDINGEQSHTSTTAATLAATEFIRSIGIQFYPVDNERVVGQYSVVYILGKYLDFEKRQSLLRDPFQVMDLA